MPAKPFVDIPFGPFLPDFGGMPNPQVPGYLTDCVGVRLTPNGYRGMPTASVVASASTVPGSTDIRSAAQFTKSQTSYFFAISENGRKIYNSLLEGTDTWNDVTPAASTVLYYGDFIRFEDDVIHTAGGTQAPIKKSLTAASATLFTPLGGSPPAADYGARVRDHVVLAGINTLYDLRWSAIGDHEDWPTPGTADARAKQSGTQELNPEFGSIQALVGGEKFGLIFQRYAITRMTYVGGSAVYEFDTFERRIGTMVTPAALGTWNDGNPQCKPVSDGRFWYWFTDGGFYATDGYTVTNLSDGKIQDALFANTLSHGDAANFLYQTVSGAYDHKRGYIIFGTFQGASSTHALCYDVKSGSFFFANEDRLGVVFNGEAWSPLSSLLVPKSVYAFRQFAAATLQLRKFTNATAPTIALQTGFIELDPGYRFQFQGAHILGNGTGSLTLAYKTAATSSACDMAQSGFTTMTPAGLGEKDTARDSAQYIAFRVTGTGAESQLMRGIRVYYQRAEEAP